MTVDIVVGPQLHIGVDGSFLHVYPSKFLDVVNRNAAYGRCHLGRPGSHLFSRVVPHGLNGNALNGRNFFVRRSFRLFERHSSARLLVPYDIRIDDGRLASKRIGIAFGWLHPQIAHPQKHAVFLYQQRRLGMRAHKFLILIPGHHDFIEYRHG